MLEFNLSKLNNNQGNCDLKGSIVGEMLVMVEKVIAEKEK